MTNEQLIEKFNPQNLGNLSADDIEIMRSLTTEQIDVLAKAYPNQPHRKAYIRLYDKNVQAGKQLYNLTTWQNLRNLRKFQSKTNLIAWEPFNVKGNVSAPAKSNTPVAGAASPLKKVVDLSAKEAAAELQKVKNANTDKSKTAAPASEKKKEVADGNKNKAQDPKNKGEKQGDGAIPADQDFTNGESE